METLFFPLKEDKHISFRNQMLQGSLRQGDFPFSIEDEYPIVLDPSYDSIDYSFGLIKDNLIISHANVWPRETTDSAKVGLIGNVATHPAFQRAGHMKTLLQHMESLAKREGLHATLLWSDLTKFYHKLGYQSAGQEVRYYFEVPYPSQKIDFSPLNNPSPTQISQILSIRPETTTLKRSIKEFLKLLTIPSTLLMVDDPNRITAFFILGKGADLVGVVHEWGGRPEDIVSGIRFVQDNSDFTSNILLCPKKISKYYHKEFSRHAKKVENHSMALGKPLSDAGHQILDDLYIWGLDSI